MKGDTLFRRISEVVVPGLLGAIEFDPVSGVMTHRLLRLPLGARLVLFTTSSKARGPCGK